MKTKLTNIFVRSACLVVILAGAYAPFAAVPKAHAFLGGPVVVIADTQRILERVADALAWTVAKTVVASLTQSVVNWINSGFEGSPAFTTDLNRNLGNLSDAVAEDFIRGLDQVVISNTGFSVRAPFQDQINRALREEYYRTTSSYGFDLRYGYRDCYGSRGFNLSGFLCESQNDANNPYGRYMLARNELFKAVDQETQNRLRELDWGRGFLSWRGPCGPNGTGTSTAATNLGRTDNTVGCSIRTPGAVIETTLGIAATSPFRQLELADSIDEIVGALMTQMVSQVLGGGGLSGLSQPSSGGGSSYIDRAGNPVTSLSGGFAQNISNTRIQFAVYQTGWQRIRDAASNARQACTLNSSKAADADLVLNLANSRLNETTAALTELANIETERVRLVNAGTSDTTTVSNLINRFTSLLSRTGSLAEGEAQSQDTGSAEPASLYTQMTRLASSCR